MLDHVRLNVHLQNVRLIFKRRYIKEKPNQSNPEIFYQEEPGGPFEMLACS